MAFVLFSTIKTMSCPYHFMCHHPSVTQEKSLINKRKALNPNLNIVKGKAALFDIFSQHAFICLMAFTSSGISVVCQLSS